MSSDPTSQPPPASDLAAPGKKKALSLGVIFLTLYIDLVGFSIIFPLFPEMLKYYLGLEGDHGLLGGVMQALQSFADWTGGGDRFAPVLFGGFLGSLYSLLQFACAPIWGGLSDKYGRRNILLITVAGTALSYLLWAFSGSFLYLVLARLFGGAMAGNISVATAAVADVTSRENRAKGMGMVGAAFGLGFVTGPAIGGLSVQLNLLEANPDLAAFGINPFSVPALVACALAVINLAWVAARFTESLPFESRAKEHPVLDRSPIRSIRAHFDAPVRLTLIVYFVFIFAFSGLEFSLSFLAVDRFGFTMGQITIMMVYIGFVLIITQGGIVRRIVPKYGERRVAIGGMGVLVGGFWVLSLASSVTWLYIGLGLTALGAGCTTPALTALVSLYSPADRQGSALGSFRSLGALGRAIGPIIAASVFWFFGSAVSYGCGGLILLLPIIVAFRLPPVKSNG